MQENFDLKELMELLDTMQLRLLKEKLIEMNEVDIAAFIEELDSEKTVVVYRMLPKELASDVFACLPVEKQEHIINSITDSSSAPLSTTCLWTMPWICWRSCRPMWSSVCLRTPRRTPGS